MSELIAPPYAQEYCVPYSDTLVPASALLLANKELVTITSAYPPTLSAPP